MGIRFTCPNGHQLHVKTFLAGKRGMCPKCGASVLIPAEQSPSAEQPPVPQGTAPVVAATLAVPSGVRNDFGSQSIVIAVTDSVETSAREPIPATASVPSLPHNGIVQPQIAVPIPAIVEPLVDASALEPISPAVKYVAQRERNRRNQFTLAVFLLIAVVVLGVVLFWVLRHNSQPPVSKTAVNWGPVQSSAERVAKSSALNPFTAADVQLGIS